MLAHPSVCQLRFATASQVSFFRRSVQYLVMLWIYYLVCGAVKQGVVVQLQLQLSYVGEWIGRFYFWVKTSTLLFHMQKSALYEFCISQLKFGFGCRQSVHNIFVTFLLLQFSLTKYCESQTKTHFTISKYLFKSKT